MFDSNIGTCFIYFVFYRVRFFSPFVLTYDIFTHSQKFSYIVGMYRKINLQIKIKNHHKFYVSHFQCLLTQNFVRNDLSFMEKLHAKLFWIFFCFKYFFQLDKLILKLIIEFQDLLLTFLNIYKYIVKNYICEKNLL